jgi:hypothetical protein
MGTGRRRAVATLGAVLGMALLAGLVAAVVGRPSSPAGPVYTVAQVRAGLARRPAAWAGRTALVRGAAVESAWATGPTIGEGMTCGARPSASGNSQSCPLVAPNGRTLYLRLVDDSTLPNLTRPFLMSQQDNRLTLLLAVQPIAPNPLIALARRLPPLARFLPMQGQVPGGVSHLYRIRLQPAGSAPCARPAAFNCATGVLVDAQP